jgi:hypothetical protein
MRFWEKRSEYAAADYERGYHAGYKAATRNQRGG